jgi:hypothetical protein
MIQLLLSNSNHCIMIMMIILCLMLFARYSSIPTMDA